MNGDARDDSPQAVLDDFAKAGLFKPLPWATAEETATAEGEVQ